MKQKRKYEEPLPSGQKFLKEFGLLNNRDLTEKEIRNWIYYSIGFFGILILLLFTYIFGSAPIKIWLYNIDPSGEPFFKFRDNGAILLFFYSFAAFFIILRGIFPVIKYRYWICSIIMLIILIINTYVILGSFTRISSTGFHYKRSLHTDEIHHSWSGVEKVVILIVPRAKTGQYLQYDFHFSNGEVLSLQDCDSEKFLNWAWEKKIPIEAGSDEIYRYEEFQKYLKSHPKSL